MIEYTNSAYSDLLADYIQYNCVIPTLAESFHIELTEQFQLDAIKQLQGKFYPYLQRASHKAIYRYYQNVFAAKKHPDPSSAEFKQFVTKINLKESWNRFEQNVKSVPVSFSISKSLLPSRTISSLTASDIDTLVSFEASILGAGDRLAQIHKVKTSKKTVAYEEYNPKEDGRIIKNYYEYLQYLTIEEIKTENNTIKSYKITLKIPDSLVDKIHENKKYVITGWYRAEDDKAQRELNQYSLFIEGLSIKPLKDQKTSQLTNEEAAEFRKLATEEPDRYLSQITTSYAPHIYENDTVKLGMMLAHLKSVDLGEYRSELFLLLIGVPGGGKSEILKYMKELQDDFVYVDSQGASVRGLLFSQVEYKKQKILHRGVLLKYKNVVIDEFDKLDAVEKKALNTVIEQRIATYNKSPFDESETIDANLTIGANTTNNKWIPEKGILKNLESVGDTVVDRALIIRVMPNQNTEQKLRHVFGTARKKPVQKEPAIPKSKLAALHSLASSITPVITDDAEKLIIDFLVAFAKIEQSQNQDLPIETRKELDLIRLSVKFAQIFLKPAVDETSVRYAISFYKQCLQSVGMNVERPTANQTLQNYEGTQADFFWMIFNALAKDTASGEEGYVSQQKLKEEMALSEKWKSVERINEQIERISAKGEIFEPKPGWYKRG